MPDDQRRQVEDKERKKAEVRKRLEESSKAKKAKKGFMTPERKKKLRLLLRNSAIKELKKEHERKAEERRKIIIERCGQPKNIESANEATLQVILKEYYARISKLEDVKYDLELEVVQKDYQINELCIQVNDLRGKFVKPNLRRIKPATQSKMKLLRTKSSGMSFRANLKSVENTNKFKMEEEKKEKPEWAIGNKKEGDVKA